MTIVSSRMNSICLHAWIPGIIIYIFYISMSSLLFTYSSMYNWFVITFIYTCFYVFDVYQDVFVPMWIFIQLWRSSEALDSNNCPLVPGVPCRSRSQVAAREGPLRHAGRGCSAALGWQVREAQLVDVASLKRGVLQGWSEVSSPCLMMIH